jgi:hypothetical protein
VFKVDFHLAELKPTLTTTESQFVPKACPEFYRRVQPLRSVQNVSGWRSKVPVVPIAQLLRIKTMPVRNPKISKRQRLGCGNEKLEALLRQFRNPGAYLKSDCVLPGFL